MVGERATSVATIGEEPRDVRAALQPVIAIVRQQPVDQSTGVNQLHPLHCRDRSLGLDAHVRPYALRQHYLRLIVGFAAAPW